MAMETALLTEARAALAAGHYALAQSAAAQGLQQAQSRQAWPEAALAWHLWVQVLFRDGRFPALLEGWDDQAVKHLPPRERVEVHRWAALAACECERIDVALQHARLACAAADEADEAEAPALQALGLTCLAVCFDRMGDPWQAERMLHKAIDTWEGGDPKQGAEMIKRNGLVFATDVEYALTRLRPHNVELVREELYRRARVFLQPLHDHMPTIEMIYYIAPLLGLLGTVTGIIASFQALESSGAANDAAKLAAGIWEALLCTGVGLSMAIPFAVLHSLLETRLNHIVAGVEDVIARVFTTELDIGQAAPSQRA